MKRGQVWIETVIYTLVALVIIGLVLAFAKPKIQELQDKIVLEQSLEILQEIDLVILSIQEVPGNQRNLEIGIKKGSLEIDGENNKTVFEMESRNMFTEPGADVAIGDINVRTETKGELYLVTFTRTYEDYEISFGEGDSKILTSAPNPYKLLVSNNGKNEDEPSKIKINFKLA